MKLLYHDDVIKWKHFRVTGPLCGEFTGHRRIPLTKACDAELWCFILICARINNWVNNHEASDLRRQLSHYYNVTVMPFIFLSVVASSCLARKSRIFGIFDKSWLLPVTYVVIMSCCSDSAVILPYLHRLGIQDRLVSLRIGLHGGRTSDIHVRDICVYIGLDLL